MLVLCEIHGLEIFFSASSLSPHFFTVSLMEQKLLSFDDVQLSIFPYMDYFFDIKSKNCLPSTRL